MSVAAATRLVGELARKIADLTDQAIREHLGPDSTFEQRQDLAAAVTADGLWFRSDRDLHDAVTTALDVEVTGRRYHRLEQASSATYHGRWGSHHIEEALYREVGVHNGPTLKPIELRVGIIEHMTPDMARIVGELSAEHSSRTVERTLRATGLVPPSRAFLAKRTTAMATEIADEIETFEQAARDAEQLPTDVGSVSCGLDRMAVRMSELATGEEPSRATRAEPYVRTPPPNKEHHYRMAWVGSTSIYDKQGNELHTWRYAAEASADPACVARRVAKDVAWIANAHRGVPIHCVQDGAPELRALPDALISALPTDRPAVVLVDLEHLMGYLDDVVDACHPDGDLHDWKGWYRGRLLQDDAAIEQIWRKLRGLGKTLVGRGTKPRNAVATALSYIRRRKSKMRYASHYTANLPIGSGATESTCWQMQQRVKRPGQTWEVGLRGVLAMRGLAVSGRWMAAWQPYAAKHRKEVRLTT
jgi:hypothetical protein